MIRTRQEGFTLIEILAALAVIGMVAAIGASSLRFAQESWDRGALAARQTEDLLLTARMLRDLTSRLSLEGSASGQTFQGTPEVLSLTTSMPPYPTIGGLYQVTFRIERGAQESRLLMSRALVNANPDAPLWRGAQRDSLLMNHPGILSFAYLEETQGEDRIYWTWQDEWTGAGTPAMVALRIGAAKGRPAHEVLARPNASLALSCIGTVGAAGRPPIRDDCR